MLLLTLYDNAFVTLKVKKVCSLMSLKLYFQIEEMEEVAQGRVWTGNDAVSRGLVDAIGGFSRAVAIAKQKANIPQDKQVC